MNHFPTINLLFYTTMESVGSYFDSARSPSESAMSKNTVTQHNGAPLELLIAYTFPLLFQLHVPAYSDYSYQY
jgi:hypothetical protein